MSKLKSAINEMSNLPNIDAEDSAELKEFVVRTTQEVKILGGASTSTTLEMIGHIRKQEAELATLREKLAALQETNARLEAHLDFRAVVADAMERLRERIAGQRNETSPRTLATIQFHNAAIDGCVNEINATIAELGLAEGKKGNK